MRSRRLGEVVLPRLVLGTMAYGTHHDEARQVDTICAAIDAGMTALDTAPLYHFGHTETLVGKALRRRRGAKVLGKVGIRWDEHARGEVMLRTQLSGTPLIARKDARPSAVRADVEESLTRLGCERLDLCQLHHPDPQTPIAETMGALLRLREEGKIGAIGISNASPSLLRAAAAALGEVPLSTHQLEFSLLAPHGRRDLDASAALGIGTLAYSPLHRGALVGGAASRTRLHARDPRRTRTPFVHANAARIDAALQACVAPVAARTGASIAQVVLAWLLHQPRLDTVVVGASSPAQARANAEAASLSLRPDEVRDIAWTFAGLAVDPGARPRPRDRVEAGARRVARAVLRRAARLIRPAR